MSLRLYDENDIINIANTIREKTGTSDTYKVTDMAEAISTISGGGTNLFPRAPMRFEEISFPGNDYVYTWIEPFSAENINRDWEMSFTAELATSKTSDNPVVSFSNFGSKAYCFDLFFYGNVTDLRVFVPNNSRIIGDGRGSDKLIYSNYNGERITIRKTGTDIITLVNDTIVANNSISNMSGADGCRLTLGYYYGDGGKYYFDSTIKNFKFDYLN